MSTTYPSKLFDTYSSFYGLLGSFWHNEFATKGELIALYEGMNELAKQFDQNYSETVDLLGVMSAPVYHTKRWWNLTVKKSETNTGASSGLRYAPNLAWYGGTSTEPTYVYGGLGPSGGRYTYDVDAELVKSDAFATNGIRNPSIVWVNGVDFEINDDIDGVVFYNDPFDTPGFDIRPIMNSAGVKTDEELTIWFWATQWDYNYLYSHFGSIMKMKLDSSEHYRNLLTAYWFMTVRRPTKSLLAKFFEGIVGVPSCSSEDEVVEQILTYTDKLQVITDKKVYTAPSGANAVVAIGDVLNEGDSLFDSFEIIDMSGGDQDLSGISSLSFGSTFISGDYIGELTFENVVSNLTWGGYDEDGYSIVTFDVGGDTDDIDLFWDTMLANGKLSGQSTLAEMLDTRAIKVGQPAAIDIPATINPMEYVVDNVIGNNVYIIKLNMSGFSLDAPGLHYISLLREVMAPQKCFIILVNLDSGETEHGGFEDSGPTPFSTNDLPAADLFGPFAHGDIIT
jgi:hypothetical protein